MTILFTIDQYDHKSLIIEFARDITTNQWQELLSWAKGFKERSFKKTQEGDGWVVPLNDETMEYIKAHYVLTEHYSLTESARAMVMYNRLTFKANQAKAKKRWDYVFDDAESDFNYPAILKPMTHQKVAVESMLDSEYFGLLMEMGTGKTKCFIDEMDIYARRLAEGEMFRAVIIVPKSLRNNWIKEIHKNFCPLHNFTTYILDGLTIEHFGEFCANKSRIKIVVMSYDMVARLMEFLLYFQPQYMVLDESHYVKNSDSKRFKAARLLAKVVPMRRIATGTPVANNLLDLWSQFEVLNPGALGFSSYSGFKNEFCNIVRIAATEDRTVDKITGYKNLETLKEKMSVCSFIVKKDRCLDLPDKMYETRAVEMPPNLRQMYDSFLDNFFVNLGDNGMMKTEVVIAQMTKLAQLCGGFAVTAVETGEEGEEEVERRVVAIEGGDEKMSTMIDDLEEVTAYAKVIVWCRFHYDIDQCIRRLNDKGIGCAAFDGRVKINERERIVERFNGDRTLRVMVAQPAAGGVGLTLLGNQDSENDSCRYSFFYSNGYSLGEREQAEARNHRIGQKQKVLYRDYVYESTIEEAIAKVLQEKKEVADYMKDIESIRKVLTGKT